MSTGGELTDKTVAQASVELGAILTLIKSHWPTAEDPKFTALTQRLRPAYGRKYLTKGDLAAVCKWKSQRVLPLILKNNHHQIRKFTAEALAARVERARIKALIRLHGVSIPMASSILTALNSERYGVIDIRVWRLLHEHKLVTSRPRGTHLTLSDWEEFLAVIRSCATALSMPARSVEHTLYLIHQNRATEPLYNEG
jgi:hypothetical protein